MADLKANLLHTVSGSGVLVGIDGPSGSGKSTVSKKVADRLGIAFLDTGSMYRALTWYCLENGIDPSDTIHVLQGAGQMDYAFTGTAADPHFFVGGSEVTGELRSSAVVQQVSVVAGLIPVRQWMAKEQRRLMMEARETGRGMVAEGRDVTTVVCPEADVRVLLTADAEARVRRRTLEVHGLVTPELIEQTRVLVEGRDEIDSRVSEFLKPAEGVTVINSSAMTVEQVVDEVIRMTIAVVGVDK